MAVQQIGKRLARDPKGVGGGGHGETEGFEALVPDDLAGMSRVVHLHLTVSLPAFSGNQRGRRWSRSHLGARRTTANCPLPKPPTVPRGRLLADGVGNRANSYPPALR